jgi:hypothetical protein
LLGLVVAVVLLVMVQVLGKQVAVKVVANMADLTAMTLLLQHCTVLEAVEDTLLALVVQVFKV